MSARSLNRVTIIGNVTKDPELHYTANGSPVCSITVVTNRAWTTNKGEKKEDAQYHYVVAWEKLAELLPQILMKGSKVFVDGRLENRKFERDGKESTVTEIMADDIIVLDNKKKEETS